MFFEPILIGKMLGDGHLNLTRGKPRLNFIHKLADKGYADYCLELFSQYLPFGPNENAVKGVYDKRTNKTYYRVFYQSKTSPLLEKWYPLWYKNGHKTIPCECIADYLDPLGLSIWFQDDGCFKKNRIVISTESFAQNEVGFLQFLLRKKFRVIANIDYKNRLDITSRMEVRKFQALIEPYIHSSMARKSMRNKWEQWQVKWEEYKNIGKGTCRTSIYLPYKIYDMIRGEGYSSLLNNYLEEWMDTLWGNHFSNSHKRYQWIAKHDGIDKGTYLLTPRFFQKVKKKLDLLSEASGLERSELVTLALRDHFKIC